MISNIGTAWMTQPEQQSLEIDLKPRKIESMGLGELKGYLCPKSHGDPKVCQKCPGKSACSAGQRAASLIAQIEQATSGTIAEEREIFRAACQSGNPMGWLIHEKGYNKGQAKEILIYMIERYPAITKEFGGRKQLMRDRPYRPAKRPQTQPESTTQPATEQIAAQQLKGPEDAEKTKTEAAPQKPKLKRDVSAANQAHVQIGRRNCEEALKTGDPITFLMQVKGLTEKNAKQKFYNWRLKYKDLFEKYGLSSDSPGKSARGKALQEQAIEFYKVALTQPDPIGYYTEQRGVDRRTAANSLWTAKKRYGDVLSQTAPLEEDSDMQQDEDLVSVADFIQQCDEPQTQPQKELDLPEPLSEDVNPLAQQLNQKYEELENTKQQQQQIARQAEEKIKWIEEQQDALAKVLGLFR